MPIIKVDAFKCNRCGYIWLSRQYLEDKKTIPIACSKCKSPYYNKPPATEQSRKTQKNK